MTASVTFFVVDNGDMSLIELESGRKILVDCNIRKAADDPDDNTPDVAKQLKAQLPRDSEGRLYVDAMILSHPDKDHCSGLTEHFHLGPPGTYKKDGGKILIREMWSSPMVFRRASSQHTLCPDADAWAKEARRRVALYLAADYNRDGDRILILGEDEDGKTDKLGGILIKTDANFRRVNGYLDDKFEARLLAPMPKSDDEEDEKRRSKNNSSVILRFRLSADGNDDACHLLMGGDAEVAIWDVQWQRHKTHADWLDYDMLLAPHHCSWHSLSYESWSDWGEDAEVSADARNALSQARDGAFIIASSKKIANDDDDPPCIRAKREYQAIAADAKGTFVWVGEAAPDPLEFEIVSGGPRRKTKAKAISGSYGAFGLGSIPRPHG